MAPAAKLATKGSAVCYATTDPELVRSCRTAFAASEDGASRGRELTLSLWGSVRHGGGRRTRTAEVMEHVHDFLILAAGEMESSESLTPGSNLISLR